MRSICTPFAWASHVYGQRTVIDHLAVEHLDRLERICCGFHFNKAKSLAASCVAILDHGDALDRTGLREQSLKLVLAGVVRQVPYV